MLTLRYHSDTTIPVEAECITPDNLADKSADQIKALPVQHGNRQVALGEFFEVEGDAHDGHILIEGDCTRVKWLGAGMTRGKITIQGNVGMHLGAEMKGGEIKVTGHAGDWVGAEMKGGKIHVHGNAGHLVGAAYRGSRHGMRGGAILIDGNAGNEIGATMRRGLIAIGGQSGDFPGVSMIAGTIILCGELGIRPAAGMKRGTLAILHPTPALLPSFKYSCTYAPVFLNLYLRQLQQWGFDHANTVLNANWRRYCGDLVALGKGEILVREG